MATIIYIYIIFAKSPSFWISILTVICKVKLAFRVYTLFVSVGFIFAQMSLHCYAFQYRT